MHVDLRRLTRLREESGPFWQIESPPPVAASSFIERRLESHFRDLPEYARNGISTGEFRFRMWRLSWRITEAHCRPLGYGYVRTPRAVFDRSGFLAQPLAADSTHANIEFGEHVIAGLERLAARPRWVRRLGLVAGHARHRAAALWDNRASRPATAA